MWVGAFTRAPPARDARAFRARGRPSFPQSITQALGGLVAFGPSGIEPALSHPRRGKTPPGAAGTCQASIRGDAASAWGPGRPSKPCGSDAAGGTLMRRNRFRPFARDTLAPSTPMGQAPALAGAKLRKLPARRYGSRQPELTASRQPGLRGPRPSVQDGRHDKCGTAREGVEKIRDFAWSVGAERRPRANSRCPCDRLDCPPQGKSGPSHPMQPHSGPGHAGPSHPGFTTLFRLPSRSSAALRNACSGSHPVHAGSGRIPGNHT